MKTLDNVVEKFSRTETKRAERRPAQGFVAHYRVGRSSRQGDIKNISSTGLFLLTEERWVPGTVVSLTLQMQTPLEAISEHPITVEAKTVLWGEDGVGFSFVLPDDPDETTTCKMIIRTIIPFLHARVSDTEPRL